MIMTMIYIHLPLKTWTLLFASYFSKRRALYREIHSTLLQIFVYLGIQPNLHHNSELILTNLVMGRIVLVLVDPLGIEECDLHH